MKYLLIIIANICFLLVVSCQPQKQTPKQIKEKELADSKYINPKDIELIYDSISLGSVKYKDSIKDWKNYYKVQDVLTSIAKTSPNNVLSASDDLVEKIIAMQKKIPVVALRSKGIKARLNALYNQSLRLKEMSTIPAITVDEISQQTAGLFVIFRTIEKKIDAIYEQVNFEQELIKEEFFFLKKILYFKIQIAVNSRKLNTIRNLYVIKNQLLFFSF